jgi:hypothetical protein
MSFLSKLSFIKTTFCVVKKMKDGGVVPSQWIQSNLMCKLIFKITMSHNAKGGMRQATNVNLVT